MQMTPPFPPSPFFFIFFPPPITVPLMRCKICALMTEKLFRSGGELIGFNHGLHPSGYARQQTTLSWCLIRHIVGRYDSRRRSSPACFLCTWALFRGKVIRNWRLNRAHMIFDHLSYCLKSLSHFYETFYTNLNKKFFKSKHDDNR